MEKPSNREGLAIQYLVSFIAGISAFFSPSLLTAFPVFLSYFASGSQRGIQKTVQCALGFVIGTAVVFVAASFFPAFAGGLLRHQRIVNWIGGSIITVFGINALGLFRWNLPQGGSRVLDAQDMTFFSAALLGILLSTVMTPCFDLSARQAYAAGQVTYFLGVGVPLLISAAAIEYLKEACGWLRRHYRSINLLSGSILIITGLLMASGILRRLLRQLCQVN